ncbi:hypothetical protein [Luteolibacter sp. Populi]|uniref:hypothetical protein n=1 Tax=Luteolibacter sp. Populi TaxID=3230487 RepID=UPI003465B5DF
MVWDRWAVSQAHSTLSISHRPIAKPEFYTDTARAVIDKPDPFPMPLFARGQGLRSETPILKTGTTYREQIAELMQRADQGTWRALLPHWLILLATALPWSALLLWRARRRKAIKQ